MTTSIALWDFQLHAQRAEAPNHEPASHAPADAGTVLAPRIAQQEPEALAWLEKIRNHYRRVRGFSAHFSLQLRTRGNEQPIRSEGRFRFAFPASIRLEFSEAGAIYTSDGIAIRLYAPENAHLGWLRDNHEVAVRPAQTQDTWLEVPADGTPLNLLLAWMSGPPGSEHLVRVIPSDGPHHVALELRSGTTPLLDRIVLALEPAGENEARIVRIMLFDFSGNSARLAFSNVQNGVQPPPAFRIESTTLRRSSRPLHVIRP